MPFQTVEVRPRISGRPRRRRGSRSGFSLLEMMLVLLIMSTLVGIVVVNINARAKRAQVRTTMISIKQVEEALKEYQFNKGAYPTTIEGLIILTPSFLDRVPKDAWKQDLEYISPTLDPNVPFEVQSAGPDKEFGTDDDLFNWTDDLDERT